MKAKTGVLLVNLGTPDAPTTSAVRRYLREFLSDPRVISLPQLPWRVLLNLVILPIRSPKVAKKYHEIWFVDGSPLRVISEQIAHKLQQKLQLPVVLGMRYGNPGLIDALLQLRHAGIENLIILPLFPQYSSATTASIFDKIMGAFKPCPALPRIQFIRDYYDHPHYIAALAESVKTHWAQHGRGQKLLILFHGLPQRYIAKGDPYQQQCQRTAQLLVEALNLKADEWQLAYQSRFGKAAWLQPYAAEILQNFPKQGVTAINVISPGFPADCLETLEEITLQYQQLFLQAGGKQYTYIPALNASDNHIDCLTQLIKVHYDHLC